MIECTNLGCSDLDQRFQFSGGLVLDVLPDWVRRIEGTLLEGLHVNDRQALALTTHGFIVTYDAEALGSPDPTWQGGDPRSIQDAKYELAWMANLALWLSCPSPVGFKIVLNASQVGAEPVIRQANRHAPLLCHPADVNKSPNSADIALAQRLHLPLTKLRVDTPVWAAARFVGAGLQMNSEVIRNVLFWIALEALFGPESPGETVYKLSQRIAFFLAPDRSAAQELFARVKKGYDFRSKVVHGRWKRIPESTALMAEAETFARNSLVKLLQDDELINTFSGKNIRDRYLDTLVFSL